MRLDHIAYRVKDRSRTVKFFCEAFGYKVQDQFPIDFEDGKHVECVALVPPQKEFNLPWCHYLLAGTFVHEYHMAPEIFVSDGEDGSIVAEWVRERGGTGGIHHLAYQVKSVQQQMDEWRAKGYAEFTTQEPIRCPGLTQVFTRPSELTGVIYEFIERGEHGFCRENVRQLMESTKGV